MIDATIQSVPITVTVQDQAPITIIISSTNIPIGIPTGGLTGQVLMKHSNADYDCEWVTLFI